MQRRTLLLFTLFVVTAWFYSSFTDDSVKIVAESHKDQAQMLRDAEKALSESPKLVTPGDQG